jgi:hypothetical protein
MRTLSRITCRHFCRAALVGVSIFAWSLWGTPANADWASGEEAFKRGDFTTAHNEWLPAAEAGDARAQAALGSLYIHGEGVAIDHEEALKWTSRAAEQGDITGQFNMGTIHAGGLGVDQDYTKAAEWFERAAAQDDAPSRYNLGILHARGLGVPRNDVYALFMLSTATIIAGDPETEVHEIAAAAENYSYVVMMTMTEAQIQEAIERTRTWESEFLKRYIKQRFGRRADPDAGDRLPEE